MHVSNYFYNEENILLADELCAKSGMARAIFCNSGAEANEALFKLARRHFYAKGEKRTKIIAFHNAFHGRTMGALSMTGTPKYREGFGAVEGVVHVAYGDLDAVKAQMGADVAAVIVEPVQGEGGVLPAPAGFLSGLRALCDEHGALLLMRRGADGHRPPRSLVRLPGHGRDAGRHLAREGPRRRLSRSARC